MKERCSASKRERGKKSKTDRNKRDRGENNKGSRRNQAAQRALCQCTQDLVYKSGLWPFALIENATLQAMELCFVLRIDIKEDILLLFWNARSEGGHSIPFAGEFVTPTTPFLTVCGQMATVHNDGQSGGTDTNTNNQAHMHNKLGSSL